MRLLVQAVVAGCVQALSLSIDNSSIRLEEFYHLSLCQPHGFSFRLDIQLSLAILALIDGDLVVQVDQLHRFMGYRKLLVAKIIHLLLRT